MKDKLFAASTASAASITGAAAAGFPSVGLGIGAAGAAVAAYPLVAGGMLAWALTVALSLTVADSLLSDGLRLALTASLGLLAAIGAVQPSAQRSNWTKAAIGMSVLVISWWMLEIANTNVPSLEVGLSGLRKSAFLFVGLWIGIALAERTSLRFVMNLVTGLLFASLSVALLVHHLAPGIEASLERQAAESTATFEGNYRLVGLFSGPFHAALAAGALLALALSGFMAGQRTWRSTAILAGIAGLSLLEAQVRTGYVAAACLVVYLLIARPDLRHRRKIRTVSAIAMFGVAGYAALRSNVSVASLQSAGTDRRLNARFDSYDTAFDLVANRPLLGHGSGSAADTLTAEASWTHVTSHNMVLKYAIEGGLVGLSLVLLLLSAVWIALRGQHTHESIAARGMLIVMLAMGLTGSIVEALPVTLWIFVALGAALERPPTEGEL